MSGKMSTESKQSSRRSVIESPLHVAVNHRLIFNTKAEAEELLGHLKNLSSERKIEEVSARLDDLTREKYEISLRELTELYLSAVRTFFGESFRDEKSGNLLRAEARRRLAVKLFEWAFAAKNPVALDNSKWGLGSVSHKIFRHYCPEPGGEEAVDVCFTVLLHRGIIRPTLTRADDYPADQERNRLMRSILLEIRDELPSIGLFRTVPSINSAITEVDRAIARGICLSAADYWGILRRVAYSLVNTTSDNPLDSAGLEIYDLDLPGIWVDDDDRGRSRFWIFPANLRVALCFTPAAEGRWTIQGYEFFINTPDIDDPDYSDDFGVWCPLDDTQHMISHPGFGLDAERIAYFSFDFEQDAEGVISRLELRPYSEFSVSELPLLSFSRLSAGSERFNRFARVLEQPERIKSPYDSVLKNRNSLLGLDRDFVYLFDCDLTALDFEFRLDSEDNYTYTVSRSVALQFPRNLYEALLEPPACGELLRIPRIIENPDARIPAERFSRLKYALENLTLSSQVTIYHFHEPEGNKTIIFFNDLSIGMTLKEAKDQMRYQQQKSHRQ